MEVTQELKNKRDNLIKIWQGGGEFAHNCVAAGLREIATNNEEYANEVYKELQDDYGY